MASNEVKIKVIIDGHTHSLNAARKDVNELGKSLANTDTVANALKSTFGKIALSLGGISAVGLAFKNIAVAGIEANRSFENLKIQLTGLISANSSNVSLLGKTLDAHSKWNLGMAESEKILKKLNETNAKTKFTLEEIAGAFNMFYATSAGQGSRDKAVQAMDSIALAAQAVGKNIRDLTPMMDSLATGTVIAASEMGSFMKIVGLSNEELKKANENGKVYDYLIEKLAKFKELSGEAANGYEVALGSLKNELTELNKELSKPIFEALTTGMVGFSNLLRENKEDLVKYGGYAVETVKHLSLLAGSFIAAKGAAIALSGAFSVVKGAIGATAVIMPAFTSSLTLSITTATILEKGLATLNRAFATLLPAATIYLLYESIDAIKALNGNLEDGAKNLNSVQKWIYRFLDSFTTQLQIAHIKIYQFINDLKIMALKAKEFFDSINPFSKGEGAKNTQKDIALLEKYNQAYDDLIEKYKQGAVAKELNLQGFNLDENGNILTDAKQKVDKLKDSVDKLGGSAGNAGKKDLNAMKAALKDIAEVNFSDMELKTQRVLDRYNEIISLGIDKGKAKHFLDSKLEAISNENIKAVEKSEAEAMAKQLDLRAQYYKTIGEYENAWQIEKQKIIEKYEKLTFANGEKITKEQLEKLLKMEKTAFLQGSKIAKNSFKDIKGSWADTVSTMSKTVEDGFFNLFIRKTKDLKSALKDIGQNLFRDFMSPYARNLSQGIGGLFGSFLGGGSNLASLASFYGLSKSDAGSFVGEVAGTAVEIASDGTIVKGGSAFGGASNILSMASNIKTAYTMLTSGYSGMVGSMTLAPAGQLASWLSGAGWYNTGGFVAGMGSGAHGALTGSLSSNVGGGYVGAGYVGGATLAGGALGYGVGTLGDKLFKANSYASSVGAVGGALGGAASAGAFGAKIGSMVGPWGAVIGAVVGALIGGMFGKKKATGTGISVEQDFKSSTNLSSEYIRGYVQMEKKGWFSSSEWKEYKDLGEHVLNDISSQIRQMERLSLRAGAITGLTIKKGAYGGDSFGEVAIPKAIISAMTGYEQSIWGERVETKEKRKGLLGKIAGAFDKVMKFSPSTLANKATRPLDNALGRIMNKNGLGALHEQSIEGRIEIGDIGDGKIFDFEPTKKLERKLGILKNVEVGRSKVLMPNPEIERMYKDWQNIAIKEKKKVSELITSSLVSITETYKSLALISQKNPVKQAQISMDLIFNEFVDAAAGLKVKIPEKLGDITELSVEEMAKAYREAIANDFTKDNIDGLNSLVKVYQEARKAQEDYTKSVIAFIGQISSSTNAFYNASGVDGTALAMISLKEQIGEITKVLAREMNGKNASLKNASPSEWVEKLINFTFKELKGFLSEGNVELRQQLLGLVTQYKTAVNQNNGREFNLAVLSEIEVVNEKIKALKLEEQVQSALNIQREQLSILHAQKSVMEKLSSIAQKLRDSVVDSVSSAINYNSALQKAREAWKNKDYSNKAFDNLNTAVSTQQQFFKNTIGSYEEYKYAVLRMANEIEDIAGGSDLSKISKQIKDIENAMNNVNSSIGTQISILENQKSALVSAAEKQIETMKALLGDDSPIVRYLTSALQNIKSGKNGIPSTANGAYLADETDVIINEAYKKVLHRSVEQAGLNAWKEHIQKGIIKPEELESKLLETAKNMLGSTDEETLNKFYREKGFKPFADGGIVTRPTRALIGEAGYDEAIIPLKDGRGVKVDMDGAFEKLANKFDALLRVLVPMAKDTKEMAITIRNSSVGDRLMVEVISPVRVKNDNN